MILEEETYKKFGYYPSDLKPQSHKQILAICDECGRIRETSKNGYCALCLSCARKGKNNYSWKGGSVERKCLICGKPFFAKRQQINRGTGKYCSRSCARKAKSGKDTPGWRGGPIKRKCKTCGIIFYAKRSQVKRGRGKYCSKSCARKGENHYNWQGGPIECTCSVCGKNFFVPRCRIKKGYGKYCSFRCSRKVRQFSDYKTKPELMFEEICKQNKLPFKFVGDRTLWLGNANPDFIHETRKLVVEIFGDYWHSPLINANIKYIHTLEGRAKQLKAEGYKLIVFWESDLKREDAEAFILYTLKKHNIFPSTTQ